METTSRALEITVISGEDLHDNQGKPVRRKAFVIVQADSQTVKSTKIDVEGGSNPAWNEKLVVQMPMHEPFFAVEVQCKVSNGCKVIGRARIPVSDFVGGYFPGNYLHFLSYRLRDENGERNGIINLSVRMKVPENGGGGAYYFPPWSIGGPAGEKVSNYGILAGVPVWNS